MSGTFNFCPTSLVAETLPPEPTSVSSMNGWVFTSKPKVPFLKKFRVTLHGLRWFLNTNGTYNTISQPTSNARLLEEFYQVNGAWDHFAWTHPHLGYMFCRFAEPVTVPAAKPDSGGLLEPLEITLVQHNPGYT